MNPTNRLWMYDRVHPNRGGIKPEFYAGVEQFIRVACRTVPFMNEQRVRCPCARCKCRKYFDMDTIRYHLYKDGFMTDYWVWTMHGEVAEQNFEHARGENAYVGGSSSRGYMGEHVTGNVNWEDNSRRYEEMIYDAVGPQIHADYEPFVEAPNAEAEKFFSILEAVRAPLWEGCVHSELSLAVRMLAIKSEANQSQSSFEQWATLISEISPQPSSIPKDFYQAKKLVSKLGLKSEKIDCCLKGCMLYYKDDADLTECKFCENPRFKPKRSGNGRYKDVPYKRMHYLPLIPRLKRLYASMSSAPHMRWHFENKRNDGVMTHPSHGEAWKHFDQTYPDFAADPRNIRLGLSADGFTPNNQFSKPYSCWPVVVTLYNLPPEMCMKDPYMFLTCIIPGPNNPKAKIDIYLQPLIDEPKELWYLGAQAYDISMK